MKPLMHNEPEKCHRNNNNSALANFSFISVKGELAPYEKNF